ncbi:hypothetical protein [Streptomyces showdoensis]|uniref:Peptidase C39-like domain-containing protein n=1 Tax=Streptomyces showdoensis TaxID=68268 RepID=A0A2P2GTM4_STREW|nr:hypothetical protein [Streptomyces showdoensis]KKZ74275.1 hypothetical protein VO63_09060 [Streptomyces showdoensis]
MPPTRTRARAAVLGATALLTAASALPAASSASAAASAAATARSVPAASSVVPVPAAASAASAADPAPGAWYKAARDTLGPQRLTPAQHRLAAAKQAAAEWTYAGARALAGYKLSGALHQSQKTSYWCGPATLVITQSAHDEVGGRSQQDAATLLKATSSGTAWYGIDINVPNPTGYPMADALNYRLPGAGYVPKALPYTPTATDKATFKQHITHDTDNDYAIAGNAWEVPGGPHLVGHPNIEIFHWVSIDGYNTDTAAGEVNYLDPVGGVSTGVISWAGPVPKSAHISSDTLTTIMGGRGYVW